MYLVLIHDRRLTECWSQLGASLRTAQAIGLHRDGSKLGLEFVYTKAKLMKVLSKRNIGDGCGVTYIMRINCMYPTLFKLISRYSLVLGRPPSISDSYTDAMAPSNVELSDFDPVTGSTSPLNLWLTRYRTDI